MTTHVAPFPYFGGKRRIAPLVWERFGKPARYIEPFAGGLAVALAAPHQPAKRIYNDLDGLLVNAWRAIRDHPDDVWRYADRPIAEVELTAIHAAMRAREIGLVERLKADHAYSDPEVAGWWVWGACASVGTDWHKPVRPNSIPEITSFRGLLSWRAAGQQKRLHRLSAFLAGSIITCGDWKRAVSKATILGGAVPHSNVTAIYLDPPYWGYEALYRSDNTVWPEVLAFCLRYGDNPRVRIALSGYAGDAQLPGWRSVAWTANGGYGNQGTGPNNRHNERVWFSPHCLAPPVQLSLFDGAA